MSVAYREYIDSDTWKLRRVDALQRSSRRLPRNFMYYPCCEFCGKHGTNHKNSRSRLDPKDRKFRVEGSNGLHVHHVTYERLGKEDPDDLIVLCTDVCYYDAYYRSRIGPLPRHVGCHEQVHRDPEFARQIKWVAGQRRYR